MSDELVSVFRSDWVFQSERPPCRSVFVASDAGPPQVPPTGPAMRVAESLP